MYCVYKHTTPCGKVYIGITSQSVSSRWRNGYGYQRNSYFWKAIQKYGWENIKHEILFDSLTKEEAEAKEIQLIAEYCSTDSARGYNIDNGGNSIGMRSDTTKKKISLSNSGKKRSAEACRKNSEAHKGIKNPNFGKHFSDDRKKKIGDAQRGGKHPFAKAVVQIDLQGNEIKIFASTMDVERELGIKHTCISGVCKGKMRTAGGFVWRYAE